VATPHGRLRSLVSSVIWYELTEINEPIAFGVPSINVTYSVWILLRTNQHKFQERLDAGSE
jgi:hypothetical protein